MAARKASSASPCRGPRRRDGQGARRRSRKRLAAREPHPEGRAHHGRDARALGSLKDPARCARPSCPSPPTTSSTGTSWSVVSRHAAASHPIRRPCLALIRPLLLRRKNPQIRMEDVAIGTLVAIGRPSLQPLLDSTTARTRRRASSPTPSAKGEHEGLRLREALAVQALGVLGFREDFVPSSSRPTPRKPMCA